MTTRGPIPDGGERLPKKKPRERNGVSRTRQHVPRGGTLEAAARALRIAWRWLAGPLGLTLLIAASALEILKWPLGPATLRPIHIVGVLVLAGLVIRRTSPPSRIYPHIGVGATAIVGLSLAPLAVHLDWDRVLFPGLLIVNLLIAGTAEWSARSTREPARSSVIAWTLAVVMLVSVLQAVVAAIGIIEPFRDARFFGVGRAPGTFEEATWAGAWSAVAAVWAYSSGRRWLLGLAIIALALSSSRSAIVVAMVPILVDQLRLRCARQSTVRAPAAIYLAILAIALAWTPITLLQPRPAGDSSSIDSRILDEHAILARQTGAQILVGADSIHVFDASRNRRIPATSNNVAVDFFRKQGVFGIAVLTLVATLAIWIWPAALRIASRPWAQPPMLMAVGLVLVWSVTNNAWLRPWTWVLYGVAIGLARTTSSARESGPKSET